jgi:hypothetical protein
MSEPGPFTGARRTSRRHRDPIETGDRLFRLQPACSADWSWRSLGQGPARDVVWAAIRSRPAIAPGPLTRQGTANSENDVGGQIDQLHELRLLTISA